MFIADPRFIKYNSLLGWVPYNDNLFQFLPCSPLYSVLRLFRIYWQCHNLAWRFQIQLFHSPPYNNFHRPTFVGRFWLASRGKSIAAVIQCRRCLNCKHLPIGLCTEATTLQNPVDHAISYLDIDIASFEEVPFMQHPFWRFVFPPEAPQQMFGIFCNRSN